MMLQNAHKNMWMETQLVNVHDAWKAVAVDLDRVLLIRRAGTAVIWFYCKDMAGKQ